MDHFATIFASARLSARARQIMIDKAAASAQITAVYYSKDLGVGVEGGAATPAVLQHFSVSREGGWGRGGLRHIMILFHIM